MQQVIQNIRNGETSVASVPVPAVSPGQVLIANQYSLVSAGTEKMIVDLAKKSLLGKARERPDHVKRVLQKIRSEGLFETVDAVRKKLDEPMKMGYSAAGVVVACGQGVQHFKPGDRVASNGPHAEVVSVPHNLVASVPDAVPLDQAAFGVLGSIALQGVRLAKCQLGETVLVIGLGLVGQLTVALLSAAGVRVLGSDPDPGKCQLALTMGASRAVPNLSPALVQATTAGLGADAVVITASTPSNGPIEAAAEAVRQKGRIVLVGVVGLEIDRRPFYFKECEFVVSCSYGPGRYDEDYEQRGHDYPPAYVRWTEQRNIAAVLECMGQGKLDVTPLISHRYAIAQATEAYRLIESAAEPFLGVLLEYPRLGPDTDFRARRTIRLQRQVDVDRRVASKATTAGVLGAGNFARMVLIPALTRSGRYRMKTICSAHGMSGTSTGQAAGFEASTTDPEAIFEDPELDTVFALTRHHEHFEQVRRAIEVGKSIFVEKPLCLTEEELRELDRTLRDAGAAAPAVMVGFNRRFAPATFQLKQFFDDCVEPLAISIRFNAGDIASDHWTQHDDEGGGRLIGEACHAIDLATYLVGSLPVRVYAESVGNATPGAVSDDRSFITLRHQCGGLSSIAYLAGGDKAFPKERVEVIGGGKVGVIDDFRALTTCAGGKTRTERMKRNKGHLEELVAWADCVQGRTQSPIGWEELHRTTLASIRAVRSLREGQPFGLEV